MTTITSNTGRQHYRTVNASPTHQVIADETTANGGGGEGFSPHELLAAALASCTGITLRMYADRKQWDVEAIDVQVRIGREGGGQQTVFEREISLTGQLGEEERKRMMQIAAQCPVHKILEKASLIETILR